MIELRPHHGMCIGQFVGNGYNKEFVENMERVISILETENPIIKLVCHTDTICDTCPHNKNDICHSGQKVLSYDESCLKLCGLEANQEIRWLEFKNKVKENIIYRDRLKSVCLNCSWIELCIENIGKNY